MKPTIGTVGQIRLNSIIRLFEIEREAEGNRFRKKQGVLRISAYNPRSTQKRAEDRHRDLMLHIRRWTEQWWEDNGYNFEFKDDESTEGTVTEAKL